MHGIIILIPMRDHQPPLIQPQRQHPPRHLPRHRQQATRIDGAGEIRRPRRHHDRRLDLHVAGAQPQRAAIRLQQHMRQDRDDRHPLRHPHQHRQRPHQRIPVHPAHRRLIRRAGLGARDHRHATSLI
jgi:hypothetical protein